MFLLFGESATQLLDALDEPCVCVCVDFLGKLNKNSAAMNDDSEKNISTLPPP